MILGVAVGSSSIPVVITVLGSLAAVFLLVLCICKGPKDSLPSPIASLHDKFRAITTQPTSSHFQGNGVLPAESPTDIEAAATDNSRIKVPTLQRRLPDIPVLPVQLSDDQTDPTINSQSPDTGSELYATVDNSASRANPSPLASHVVHDDSVDVGRSGLSSIAASPLSPVTDGVDSLPPAVASVVAASKEGREATPSSGDSDLEHPYSHVQHHKYAKVKREHPYDWLKGQTSEERDTDTDNYDDPQLYAQGTSVDREWAPVDSANAYEPPPPVPEKHFDLAESPEDVRSDVSLTLTAANAMSGRVPTSEIPYVTSPLDSPTAHVHFVEEPVVAAAPELVYNTSQDSGDGGRQDVRYTSISVREPLANIRSQVVSLSRSEPESYYSVVSDDDPDQTYAEIRSGQMSSNSSVTYACIEPPSAGDMRELPPIPPPVEILRSLASAHSRQASSSSTLSGHLGAYSPDPESLQSSSVGSNPFLSSPHSDVSDLYSTVDKTKVADRRTIHVTEPQSLITASNLEEMYAKVLKNKRLSLRQDISEPSTSVNTGAKPKIANQPPTVPLPELPLSSAEKTNLNTFSDPKRPKSMITYSEQDYNGPQNIPLSSSTDNILSFHGDFSRKEPGYEKVVHGDTSNVLNAPVRRKTNNDPGYEIILENNGSVLCGDPDYETLHDTAVLESGYEIMPSGYVEKLSSDYGYEMVFGVKQADPEYEQIGQNYTEEPGYESVPIHLHNAVGKRQEPGYEEISNRLPNVTDERVLSLVGRCADVDEVDVSDPEYETVQFDDYSSNVLPSLRTTPYETVNSPFQGANDYPNDPAYERVNFYESSNVSSDPGYETVNDLLNSLYSSDSQHVADNIIRNGVSENIGINQELEEAFEQVPSTNGVYDLHTSATNTAPVSLTSVVTVTNNSCNTPNSQILMAAVKSNEFSTNDCGNGESSYSSTTVDLCEFSVPSSETDNIIRIQVPLTDHHTTVAQDQFVNKSQGLPAERGLVRGTEPLEMHDECDISVL